MSSTTCIFDCHHHCYHHKGLSVTLFQFQNWMGTLPPKEPPKAALTAPNEEVPGIRATLFSAFLTPMATTSHQTPPSSLYFMIFFLCRHSIEIFCCSNFGLPTKFSKTTKLLENWLVGWAPPHLYYRPALPRNNYFFKKVSDESLR